MKDVVIIGAGVIGSFIAHELCRYKLDVLVIEKGGDVASGATMANSAIIHSGYDPIPHSLKAKYNVEGNKLYDEICEKLDVPFARIGSWTLAFTQDEYEELKKLQKRGQDNGVYTRLLSKEEVLKEEPFISSEVYGALEANTAGIINPFLLTAHLMEHALDHDVHLHLNEEVIDIKKEDNFYQVITNKGVYETKVIINASGGYAHKITSMLETPSYEMTPRKGEYFVLNHFNNDFLHHVLFTLPSEKGKGVLISPTTSYNYLVGPSSEPCSIDDNACDLYTLEQVKNQALRMMPNLPLNEIIRVFAGIRPTASKHDFIIRDSEINPGFIELAGIESPGLASAPAIAKYVIELLQKHFIFENKENYNDRIKPYISMKNMPIEERIEVIKNNPRYGNIICRCEQVSEQEIIDLFHRSLKPMSVKAVKKRVRTGFGKCQGGMCQSLLLKIMARELQCSIQDVTYDGDNTTILKYDLKEKNHD